MQDVILVLILAVIIGLAAWYVIKAKKSGRKCIGCPDGAHCPHSGTSECSCGKK
ncbi:MAG: FeoB-associated Cys-rich membrane protein [Clostridia bacterium]|nr:FeoB-associated Cys-rich membrane protein [Clostridia bacterium]